MRNGWQVKPLQSLCNDLKQDIVDGPFGSELQRKDYVTKGVPVLKIQNIKPFAIELKKMDYVSPAKFQELKRHSYRPGDIVMTKLGSPLGVSAIVEDLDEGVIVADLVRIRAQRINTKYLCYHLNSQQTNDFINSMQKGTTRPRVTLSVVRELPIAVPSPEEQQRIVGILDEAFDGIAKARINAEKNLKNARALFESRLQAVFTQRGKGWIERPLAELCASQRVITYGVIKLGNETPNGIPCLRTSNVRWLRIETEGIKRITPALSSEYSRTILKGGEVLVNVRGTLGGVAVASTEMAGWNVSREVAVVPVDSSRVNPEYVCYLIGSGVSQQWLGNVKKGAAYIGINIEDLRQLPVSAPNLEHQQEIVRHLATLQKESQRLESLYQRKLATLDELKKSLLHQAFSGGL